MRLKRTEIETEGSGEVWKRREKKSIESGKGERSPRERKRERLWLIRREESLEKAIEEGIDNEGREGNGGREKETREKA